MKKLTGMIFFIAVACCMSSYGWADLQSGLVAYYPFNGNADDASGNGNDATVTEAVPAPDRFGKADQAYLFDGVDDKILAPHDATLDPTGQISVAAWVLPLEVKSQYLINKGGSPSAPYRMSLTATGNVGFAIYLEGAEYVSLVIKEGYSITQWSLCVGTYDGIEVKLYVNGELADSLSATGNITSNTSPLLMGTRTQLVADTLHGTLDEVRIYDRALTESEIRLLWKLGPPPVPILPLLLEEP